MVLDNYNGAPLAEGPLLATTAVKGLAADTAGLLPTVGSAITAKAAIISVRTAGVVYTLGGATPDDGSSPPVGHPLAAGATIEIIGEAALRAFKVTRDGAADANLYVTVFG